MAIHGAVGWLFHQLSNSQPIRFEALPTSRPAWRVSKRERGSAGPLRVTTRHGAKPVSL